MNLINPITRRSLKMTTKSALTALAIGAGVTISVDAAILEVNNTSSLLSDSGVENQVLETTVQNISFNANDGGTADAVIVILSSESGASAGQVSISYAGVDLDPVIDHIGSQPSIWYLNLSDTTYAGGASTLVLDMTAVGTVNGYGIGIVSVSAGGNDIDVHAFNTNSSPKNDTSGQSVSLTTTETSFVVAGHRANATNGAVAANTPLDEIYASTGIGSSTGAAGYDEEVLAGIQNYSFNSASGANGFNSSAAAFVVVPEPGSLALLAAGGLLMIKRRRRS